MQKESLNTIKSETDYRQLIPFTVSLASVFIVLILVLISMTISGDGADSNGCFYERLDSSWVQTFSDGSVKRVDVPGNLKTTDGRVVIRTTIPDNVREGMFIVAQGDRQDIYMYVDGTCRESYCVPYKNGKTGMSPAAFIFMPVSEKDAGKKLTIEFYSVMPLGSGVVRDIYLGTDMGIWMSIAKYSGWSLCMGIITFALAIVVMIASIYLSIKERNLNEMIFLSLGCMAFSLWNVLSNHLRQFVFPGNTNLYNAIFYVACFMQVPMAVYLNIIKKYRYDKLLSAAAAYNFFSGIVFSYLHISGIFSFVEMLPFIISMEAIIVVIFFFILIYDIATRKNDVGIAMTIGLVAFSVTVLLEVARTIYTKLYYLTGVTSVGMIVLLACTVISAASQYARSASERDAATKLKDLRNEFLAAMSHEIRTPINGIIGLNNAILEVEKDKKVLSHASMVRDSAEELLLLVNDILDISQIEAGKFRISNSPMYVSTPVRKAVSDCREYAGYAGLLIDDTGLPEDSAAYLGDYVRITSVLKNIIAYFVSGYKISGGKIGVNISITADVKEISDICVITYKITGPAIRISKTNDAFDDIYGVASNAILGCMESELVRNVKGLMCDGFQFSVSMMKTDGTPDNDEVFEKYDLSGKRVLITDDNDINRVILKKYVIKTGAGADVVASGQEAVDLVQNISYDLILMDMRMPHMDGKEAMKRIRDKLGASCPPIIVLTAEDDPSLRDDYISDGFDDYLSKPVKYEDLRNVMVKVIGRKNAET